MKVKNPNEIEIQFVESNHYNSAYISGIFGGISPSGLLEIDFFTDRMYRPGSSIHKIENGTFGSALEGEQDRLQHTRKVEFSAMINLETAKAIQNWLADKIKDLEQISAQANR